MRWLCAPAALAAIVLAPTPTVKSAELGAADRFGVSQVAATAPGGREWYARWDEPRTVGRYSADPQDPLFVNNAGAPLRIGGGIASIDPAVTRFYVGTPKAGGEYTAPLWKNVEITIYARRGRATQAPS